MTTFNQPTQISLSGENGSRIVYIPAGGPGSLSSPAPYAGYVCVPKSAEVHATVDQNGTLHVGESAYTVNSTITGGADKHPLTNSQRYLPPPGQPVTIFCVTPIR